MSMVAWDSEEVLVTVRNCEAPPNAKPGSGHEGNDTDIGGLGEDPGDFCL